MLAVLLINRMLTSRKKSCKVKEAKAELKLDLEQCRTCLSTESLVALFNSKDSDKKRSRDLFTITGLEIKINDGLSQKICTKCIESLESALKFRRTSRKTHKSLLAVKPKPYIEVTVPVENPEPKVEEFDDGEAFGCEAFGEDFQNDDYKVEEDVKIIKEEVKLIKKKIKQKPSAPPKKKQGDVPNASSYKCTWCSKEFRMKATYKAHMRFHTNYCVCEACGKRCRNNNQLQEHKRARHGLGKIHKCAYCEYSSATKEALTIHERRHTGERPYICDHCGATFHRRSNLVQHIAIHLPDKNFQCPVCLKWEKSQKLLQVHRYNKHKANKYRYLCPECGDSFARPGYVRQHLVRGHGVPRGQQGAIQKYEFQAHPFTTSTKEELTRVKTQNVVS
ncbi:uncharacterized protein [Epargyreus clarus]|uniref:uncharacterized protein n=1 Tax=Epargyreus clarus TaxID=520877 RepID=UPI003C30402A